jgi:hypothetical protein
LRFAGDFLPLELCGAEFARASIVMGPPAPGFRGGLIEILLEFGFGMNQTDRQFNGL